MTGLRGGGLSLHNENTTRRLKTSDMHVNYLNVGGRRRMGADNEPDLLFDDDLSSVLLKCCVTILPPLKVRTVERDDEYCTRVCTLGAPARACLVASDVVGADSDDIKGIGPRSMDRCGNANGWSSLNASNDGRSSAENKRW